MDRIGDGLAIEARGVCVARDGQIVVGPVDIALKRGAALIVTGENGAGKSTLLRAIAGLLPLAAGTLELHGAPVVGEEAAERIADVCHYLGHRNAMRPATEVAANLDFWHDFLGAPGRSGVSPEAALAAFGLVGVMNVPFGHLSSGQQRRAALSRLLTVDRPIWILDEPTAALDAASTRRFETVLSDHLRAGGIAVVATHLPLDLGVAVKTLHLDPPADLGEDLDAEPAGWA